ncbi:MAG: phenylalanine--tRNA ligase subunit beta [Planctomycetota bacterium]|nr:MAG: phenylalanine--tRNA ligase subunit beta [Planctomycetota bacterium]
MNVSWNWLADYVSLDLPAEELADRLTMSGLNLESIDVLQNDTVLDLEVTSNRPDCLGHIGVAREAGVLTARPITIPEAQPETSGGTTSDVTSVSIECEDLCPAYIARVIRGVKIGPSPDWMQDRLRAIGIAPVNNVVDATNYVLMECGQPLHAFDFNKLSGRRIVVRRAREGESLQAIDHREYRLDPEMCVIADDRHPVAIGGVMGGAETEISEETADLLIETANFQPLSIHHTARSLKLHSPSSYRFERKVNDRQLDWASRRCCELILQTAGGELLEGSVLAGTIREWEPAPITYRFSQTSRVLGIDVSADKVQAILTRLGVEQVGQAKSESADFRPPAWRRDLTREIDLIEEVARIHGYDQIPEDRPIPIVARTPSLEERIDERLRSVLTAAGFHEAITFSFVTEETRGIFTPHPDAPQLKITPAAGDYGDELRQSLVPGLIAARAENSRRGNVNAELFEIARAYLGAAPADPASQPRRLAFVGGRSFADMRGVIDAAAHSICPHSAVTVAPADVPQFQAGRGAELFLNGEFWGWLGELDPAAEGVKDLKLRDEVCVCEINLQPLLHFADLIGQARPVPEQPAISRDLNFVLDEKVTWSELEQVVRESGGAHLEAVEFVEQYRGKHIPAGKKSYVLSMLYRAADRTLTNEEVDADQQAIVEACGKRLGAVLR